MRNLNNIMRLGFFYTVFNEKRAVDYSISKLRVHYPDSKVYLVSDGGLDFSYLEDKFDNIKTSLEEDTQSSTFKITGGTDGTGGNFREENHQKNIKKCVYTLLDRIERSISYCNNPDWMVMCDPDCLIRGQLNFPEGAIPISRWGASPCVFEVNTFLKALKKFRELDKEKNILDLFTNQFYALHAHDVLFPTLFALVGEEEEFNPDIIECMRDPQWKQKSNPLVHQFREYYEK